jgi:hypothetical protein
MRGTSCLSRGSTPGLSQALCRVDHELLGLSISTVFSARRDVINSHLIPLLDRKGFCLSTYEADDEADYLVMSSDGDLSLYPLLPYTTRVTGLVLSSPALRESLSTEAGVQMLLSSLDAKSAFWVAHLLENVGVHNS